MTNTASPGVDIRQATPGPGKYVLTEQQSVRVAVAHEQVRVQQEPITDANRGDARSGAAITDEEHEIVLHADRPGVDTEAVPMNETG